MPKINITIILLMFFVLQQFNFVAAAEPLRVMSPDKRISVDIILTEKIYYTVAYSGETVLQASPISMETSKGHLGVNPVIKDVRRNEVNQIIKPVWGSRNEIQDHYNQLTVNFKDNFSVEFRVYNIGMAYRFITQFKDKQMIVKNEEVSYRFNFDVSAWIHESQSYESNYKLVPLDVQEITSFDNEMEKMFLPIVVQATPKVKIAISEADLLDYPSLFLDRGNDYENFLNARFEPYALSSKTGGFSNYAQIADKEADYIAITNGSREFPWRLMIISDDDKTFLDCDLVYQLSKPSSLKDTDWIRPGKVVWDWWHDYVVEGENFKGDVNTQTYLHYVDFAAKYKLEYILVDWLWTDKYDLTLFNPEVDIRKITDYASSKGIRVLVWAPGHTLHRQLDKALDLFAKHNIAGVKADFFGREDQTGIKMYEDIAKATAERKMLIIFHGCTKPTGLSRTYPNVINYEAVAGNEYNKLSEDKVTVDHKVLMPFIRGLQGPMDFTPGGMRNLQSGHNLRFTLPQVHGTRSNEMALFVLYNEPMKMLCDAPSVYEREPDITQFISHIPTVWDETKVLNAKFGEYMVMARRTGDVWYLAGITGGQAKDITIDMSFLNEGNYSAQILKDGPNAGRIGTDYLFLNETVSENSVLNIKMVKGGGFVVKIKIVNL